MLKFNNKRDVDRHVSQLTKNLNENERSCRGYAIAKSYAKVSECEMARDWLQRYLDIKTEDATAHKFMGEIYEHLNKPEHAITSYQRAYNLNSKQNDLIKNICRLFLVNDSWTASPGKAKYWCELADTENVRDDNVLSLRLKMVNKDSKKGGGKPVEEMILKEIASRPHDVGLRIRLVKFLLDEKRVGEAFKYCFDLEMKFIEVFLLSIDWYTTITTVLAQHTSVESWNYWCLLLISIDKKIFLTLKKDLSLQAIKQNNIKEVTNLIFEFDQVLKKAADSLMILAPVKELAEEFINHFRGQLALHIASLLFQKQKVVSNDQWRETTKKCLPFLLFAFQCSTVNTEAFWLKNSNEIIRSLFSYLKKEGSFRCAQAGRTILACKSTASNEMTLTIRNNKSWTSIEDIFNQVREICVDLNWRKNIYRQLFANTDQQTKISTSYLVQNSYFQEPKYEIISFNDLDTHETIAQFLYPSSLEHHVYLGLGRKDWHTYKSHTFNGLNLSTSNLINCNPETINRIDVDSFLYCSIIQAKRRLEAEKDCYESFSNKLSEKPLILPAANMVENLCTEEQNEWWLSAFKIYKNITGENIAQLKATLQFGIEAVRGIDSPKVDVIILLKLGDILLARAGSTEKIEERRHFELRVEYVYKMAMRMLKNRDSENMRRIFKFVTSNYDIDREVELMAGTAIGHLSGIYFKREEYKEFIEDFAGLQNAWAHYFRAEAYKKLDESSKTPKKSKKLYMEKARENLMETLALLDNNEMVDKNNPLRMRVENDLKKMQYNLSSSFNDELEFHNTSHNGHIDEDLFHNASSTSFRGRRDLSSTVVNNYNEKFVDVENSIRKVSELVVSVKDDVLCVRNDITDLKDELLSVRGDIADMSINRETTTSKALNDIYKAIEDLTWNVACLMNLGPNPAAAASMSSGAASRFPQIPIQAQLGQMYNTAYPMYPMQYPTQSMMQRPPPPVIPGQMPAYDPMGQNLMMNSQNGIISMQAGVPKSSLMEALNTPSLLNTWNNTYNQQGPITPPVQLAQPQQNIATPVPPPPQASLPIQNKPVEKVPPVNIVITSSDPLPAQNSFVSQPTLSVTIPPQHIKHAPPPMFSQQPVVSSSVSQPQYEDVSPTRNPDKPNPFANFTFGQGGSANKSFSELFSNIPSNKAEAPVPVASPKAAAAPAESSLNKSHNEDEVEHYEPSAHFEPVIPLPDLVEAKTGEEDENVMFVHRAKLLRFDSETKEWKERGIGEMKVLVQKSDSSKARLLMRREQIFKLCCNMVITKDMKFKKMNATTYSFYGQDFSEPEMKTEMLAIKFKTAELVSKFLDAVSEAQANIGVVKETSKKEPEKKKETESKGFGDQFKPKIGSWSCQACYITNKATDLYCVACDSPKDSTVPKKEAKSASQPAAEAPKFSFGMPASSTFSFGTPTTTPAASQSNGITFGTQSTTSASTITFGVQPATIVSPVIPTTVPSKDNSKKDSEKTKEGFGDQSKSKAGSWSSEACHISNKASELYCVGFDSPKETSKKEPEKKKETESKGFGDQFKPKIGSWSCQACYITNKATDLYCVACDSPKDSTVPKKDVKSALQSATDAPKFSFGMPASSTFSFGTPTTAQAASESNGITFGTQSTTSGSTITFGVQPTTTASPVPPFSFGNVAAPPAEKPKETAADSTTGAGFSFGASKAFSFGVGSAEKVETLPVPAAETPITNGVGFNFVLKQKSPSKSKSPGKSRNDSVNSEGADDDVYQEEENQTYFTPVIPLPEKIDVKTGEEDEEILYSHRAKLFRFTDKEWKERGLGDIKILKHKNTGKLRVVMRRELIFKICLNIFLTNEIEWKRKDDKAWTFAANDFSEGEFEPTSFAIRFKSAEVADEFKKAIDDALASDGSSVGEKQDGEADEKSQLVKRLMLPEKFFDYLNAPDCTGCIGCNPDDYVFNWTKKTQAPADETPLPQEPLALKAKPKPRRQSVDKHVSFKLGGDKSLFGNVQEKANIFGGIKKSEGSTNIFASFNSENPPQTSIFGSLPTSTLFRDKSPSSNTSIFSSSLNTTLGTPEASAPLGSKPSEQFGVGLFGNKTGFSFGETVSSASKENASGLFSSVPIVSSSSSNIFGGVTDSATVAKSNSMPASTNIFGSGVKTFSFADAAKDLSQPEDLSKPAAFSTTKEFVPDFIQKSNDYGGFAALAATSSPDSGWATNTLHPSGGFIGLTVKQDFFSKNFNKKTSDADTSQTENDEQAGNDDNYDPHYEPIISLPDEINVSTGEEEEEKLFGERAKLFRYDTKTKEWKERGVGEIKVLHHAGNGTYRLLLRREQIFKLVLNELITSDFHMTPMNNSLKAFCWAGMNYAEGSGEAEQLAIRFKNEDLASAFKRTVDECLKNLGSSENLNPEND